MAGEDFAAGTKRIVIHFPKGPLNKSIRRPFFSESEYSLWCRHEDMSNFEPLDLADMPSHVLVSTHSNKLPTLYWVVLDNRFLDPLATVPTNDFDHIVLLRVPFGK